MKYNKNTEHRITVCSSRCEREVLTLLLSHKSYKMTTPLQNQGYHLHLPAGPRYQSNEFYNLFHEHLITKLAYSYTPD